MLTVYQVIRREGKFFELANGTSWPELSTVAEYVEAVLEEDPGQERVLPGEEDYQLVQVAECLLRSARRGTVIGWRDAELAHVQLVCVVVTPPEAEVLGKTGTTRRSA